jgi:hypothetical protein
MAKRVQDVRPKRSKEAQAWLKENVAEQKQRYAAIVREMDQLASEREQWVAEFLRIIQTDGFSVTGDVRRVIKPHEVPKKPKGMKHHQVVF